MTVPDQTRDPALSRLYHAAPGNGPPPGLDAAILAAARRAAPASPRRPAWWGRWQAPVALTATVALAVMLALTVDRHPPGSEDAATPAAAGKAAPAPTAATIAPISS